MRWVGYRFIVHYDRQGLGYSISLFHVKQPRDLAIPLFRVKHGAKLLFHVKR
jgi:hypothetical protein